MTTVFLFYFMRSSTAYCIPAEHSPICRSTTVWQSRLFLFSLALLLAFMRLWCKLKKKKGSVAALKCTLSWMWSFAVVHRCKILATMYVRRNKAWCRRFTISWQRHLFLFFQTLRGPKDTTWATALFLALARKVKPDRYYCISPQVNFLFPLGNTVFDWMSSSPPNGLHPLVQTIGQGWHCISNIRGNT